MEPVLSREMALFSRSFEPAFAAISFLVLGVMLLVWRLVLTLVPRAKNDPH